MNNGNGKPLVAEYEPVPDLRDGKQVQLQDAGGIVALQLHEGVPYAAYTWYDPASVKLGSEISFPRYFYKPMRTRDEIRADIVAMEKETERLLGKILIDAEDMI